MKNTKTTYSLLIGSEEKGRSLFEGVLYAVVIVSVAFSGWQFASHSVVVPRMPAGNGVTSSPVEVAAKAPEPQPLAL